jgi:uncharacterized protein (DUF697 family)
MDSVLVETKSAWLSKINWTQGIAMVAMMASVFGLDLDAKTQADILAGIIAVQGIVTWIMKTWFTKTVTPSAAAKA